MEEDKMQKILERIFFELRYLKENQNPPVNYAAVILTSIIVSVATTLIVIRL